MSPVSSFGFFHAAGKSYDFVYLHVQVSPTDILSFQKNLLQPILWQYLADHHQPLLFFVKPHRNFALMT